VYVPPKQITDFLGIDENSFVFSFIISSLGGFSSIFSTSVYATLFTLVNAGMNPFILAISAGLGLSVGDSIFFLLGHKGKEINLGKLQKLAKKISDFIQNKKKNTIKIFVFLYIAFTPFPNDIIMIPLGYSRIRYHQIIFEVIIGNIIAVLIFLFISMWTYNNFF
ncbi:hypothetical protein EOM09_05650, partial [bacterium]|nr:hypothetical protein [bacterium]